MIIRRRLFWKVYLTLFSSLIAVAILMGALWWSLGETLLQHRSTLRIRLPDQLAFGADDLPSGVADSIGGMSDDFTSVSIYDAKGTLIASRGEPIALPGSGDSGDRPWTDPVLRIDLPNGLAMLMRPRPPPGPPLSNPGARILSIVLIVAGGVGLGAFPLTAKLTRQLEGLRSGVEKWGAGALSIRVDDTGNDEVAVVAHTFNVAAERMEALVRTQKTLLANASHELRSPIARLRMAMELWVSQPAAAIRAEIEQNLTEVDHLVEEILLASRLDHVAPIGVRTETVDLLGLAAEEAARVNATLEGAQGADAVEVNGDATLLRRLIRNLLENSAKHGRPPIRILVTRHENKARIVVSDRGRGIAPSERARVFEPFYRPVGHGESSGGWGLGLSLVRQIAKHHGGAVACDAEAGGGSCFVVDLAMRTSRGPDQARI